MTKLTHTARTILRSRVRRHQDAPQHLAGRDVASLKNADLVQVAILMGLDIPDLETCSAYETAKLAGGTGAEALARADKRTAETGKGGHGFGGITAIHALQALANNSLSGVPAIAVVNPADEETPAEDDDETLEPGSAQVAAPVADGDEDAKAEAESAAKAKQLVEGIRGKLGRGDFAGFEADLSDLARKALTPPQVIRIETPVPVYVDPSKVKGVIPNVIGKKTLSQAGVKVRSTIPDTNTALDVYDAADAPSIDKSYLWPDVTPNVVAAMRRGGVPFLYGPAGTGKTTFVKQLAALFGRPYVRVSCNDQTEASTLVGMTVPDGQQGVKWQDGQLAAAIRRPGTIVLIDEPSVARPGALFVLQALMDDERAIPVDETGEVIRCAPGVMIVLADNTNGTGDMSGAYEGTRRLNRATLDRAAVTVQLSYMPPDKEAIALASKAACSKALAANLVKFANVTRRKADGGHVSHGIGFRRLVALAQQITDGADPAQAFQLCVIETAPHDDREPLRQIWTAEINTANLK